MYLSFSQDGHEICFVGDEAFRELSQPDPKGDALLNEVRYFRFEILFELLLESNRK